MQEIISAIGVVEGGLAVKRVKKLQTFRWAASYKRNEERKLSSLAKAKISPMEPRLPRSGGSIMAGHSTCLTPLISHLTLLCVYSQIFLLTRAASLLLQVDDGNEVALRTSSREAGLHYPIGATRVYNILATGHSNW